MFALILEKRFAHKYDVSLSIHFYVFAHEVVARKYCGSFRSPKSYNLFLECLRLPQVKYYDNDFVTAENGALETRL